MNTNARVTSKLRVWNRIDDQVYTLKDIISVSDSRVNLGTRTYHLEQVRWNQARNDPSETYRDKQSVS